MLTKMTDGDWEIVVEAFRAARSRRGDKGRDDRKFLEALHFFRGSQHHLAGLAGGVWQLEQRVEAVLAAQPAGRLRGDAGDFGRNERHRPPRPDGRFDGGARACLGGRRKRGQQGQALGRSRGGFSTKIHLKTDFDGLPLAFHLTGGEASDSRNFEVLLDIGPDITPRAVLRRQGLRRQGQPRGGAPSRHLPRHPLPREHQTQARLLSQNPLRRTRPHRAGQRQAQALQTHRLALREDRAELRCLRFPRLHVHLGQIRPHGLAGGEPSLPPWGSLGCLTTTPQGPTLVQRGSGGRRWEKDSSDSAMSSQLPCLGV